MDKYEALDGGGDMQWAAGCLDAAVAAPATVRVPGNESAAAADSVDKAAEARASCAATFAGYPDILACLEATPAGQLYTSRILDRPPLTAAGVAWSGPITLIGDAAHPMVGLGFRV